MDYGILVPFIAYIAAVQLMNKTNTGPVFAAVLATFVPFLFGATVRYIASGSHIDAIWGGVFNIKILVWFAIQFIVMCSIFKYMQETNSPVSYGALWITGFMIVIIFMFA